MKKKVKKKPKIYKKIQQEIREIIEKVPETKQRSSVNGTIVRGSTFTCTWLNNLPQGFGQNNRTGNEVLIKSIDLYYSYRATGVVLVRTTIIEIDNSSSLLTPDGTTPLYKNPSGGLSSWNDLTGSGTAWSIETMFCPFHRGVCRTLYDKLIPLAGSPSKALNFEVRKETVNVNKKCSYNGTDAETANKSYYCIVNILSGDPTFAIATAISATNNYSCNYIDI